MLGILGFLAGLALLFLAAYIFLMVLAVSVFLGAIWGFYRGILFMFQALITDVLKIGNL